jgi:putative hydrolase of the HAD superfamily
MGLGIDAVLVDNGGVLTLPDPVLVGQVVSTYGVDMTGIDLARAHAEATAVFDAWARIGPPRDPLAGDDAGRQVFLAAYAAAIGVDTDKAEEAGHALGQAFDRHRRPWSHVRPGVIEALRTLRARAQRIAIVSNAIGTVKEELADLAVCQVGPGDGCVVDAVIDSAVVGVAKPDPRIFWIALDEIGVPPERAVHVGDSVHADVEGARAAGVHAFHFDPYGTCRGTHEHIQGLAEVTSVL